MFERKMKDMTEEDYIAYNNAVVKIQSIEHKYKKTRGSLYEIGSVSSKIVLPMLIFYFGTMAVQSQRCDAYLLAIEQREGKESKMQYIEDRLKQRESEHWLMKTCDMSEYLILLRNG
jgi:hypothetical protein